MKKLMIIAAAALVALAPLYAETSKKDIANARKEAATAAKRLHREGYKTVELGDVETRLEKFFLKTYAGCTQVVGTAEKCVTSNLAQLTAVNNAANMYALNAGGVVRGRIVSSTSSLTGTQIDELVSSFERIIQKEIRGELVQYVIAVKEKKGVYAARAYCLVDPQASIRVKRLAIEAALEEQALSQQYGSLISDWIDEGFAKER